MIKKYFLAALACAALMAACPAVRAQDNPKEYLVKAAFLYNFVKFVEWPGEMAVSKRPKLDICVLGTNPFSDAAAGVLSQASTSSLQLALVEERNLQNAASHCNIVYVSFSEEAHLRDIVEHLKGKPVLTVSDIDGFAGKGGMIGFVIVDGKIKLVVNASAITQAGMRVDAQLLEIAYKVIR